MNVRIDYQPAPPPSNGPRARRGRRGRVLTATLGGASLVLLAALVLAPRSGDTRRDEEGAGDHPPSIVAPTAAAMPRGQASAAAALATRDVSGLPRGFPRTKAGAVEAGASFAGSVFVVQRMASADRSAYLRDAMLAPPPAAALDAAAAEFRARHGLTATGQLLDDNGAPSTTTRFTSQCHPALGAYRVDAFTTEQSAVDYWMPCLLGTVEDGAGPVDLATRWQMGRMALHWEAGDWRVGELTRGPFDTPVTPADAGEPVTTLEERAALLGEGWRAFADATEGRPAEAAEPRRR